MVRLAHFIIIRNYEHMMLTLIILLAASVLASGILFRHQRVLTLLAASGAIFELWWLVLVFARRSVFISASTQTVFLVGSLVFLAWWIPQARQWRWPYTSVGSGWRDAAVLLVLAPVLASAWLIERANGLVGTDWVAHGFYNGDTTTLIALVQRSLTTSGLVAANPFAGNGALEYPTLVHAGLAEFIQAVGGQYDWLAFLPLLVFVQVLITIPLFFLLRDVIKDVPAWQTGYRWGWRGLLLEAAVVGYVLGLSWEAYVYPQGHFFTSGLFVLLAALLAKGWGQQGRHQYTWTGMGAVLAVLLLFSNAVTGLAAAAVWAVFGVLRWADAKRSWAERNGYALSVVGLFILAMLHTPGDGALQLVPNFSYTAAHTMALLGVPLVLLLGAVVQQLRHQSFIGTTTITLGALAAITFLFSGRDIVVDNASRFFYHALLIGWPLGVDGIVRGARVVQARMRHLEAGPMRLGGIAALLLGLFILLLPVGASLGSVHDHLLFKNAHVSNLPVRLAMEWVHLNTPPEAVFLASPDEPWEIPLFTGRALLRTNYWLSPGDDLQQTVNDAFAGDAAAQEEAAQAADYVLLKADEQERWNLSPDARVYNFGGVQIYTTGYAVAD